MRLLFIHGKCPYLNGANMSVLADLIRAREQAGAGFHIPSIGSFSSAKGAGGGIAT